MNNAFSRRRTSSRTNPINSMTELKKRAREKFYYEYRATKDWYFIKVINDIIYNEKTLVVANFKEYLIYDDNADFMKR
jgi:hypothetical protein